MSWCFSALWVLNIIKDSLLFHILKSCFRIDDCQKENLNFHAPQTIVSACSCISKRGAMVHSSSKFHHFIKHLRALFFKGRFNFKISRVRIFWLTCAFTDVCILLKLTCWTCTYLTLTFFCRWGRQSLSGYQQVSSINQLESSNKEWQCRLPC